MSLASAIQRIQFGPFELNLQSGELLRNGRKVRLQGQSFQVLSVLLERAGKVVTREELQQILWPGDTFVDFDSGLNNAVKRLRETLGDTADKPRYIETLPRRGYRFIAIPTPVEAASPQTPVALDEASPAPVPAPEQSVHTSSGRFASQARWFVAVGLLLLIGAGALLLRPRTVQTLTAKDTVVLGEFQNKTSDPVFDETLRRGLAVELEQSPYLSIVSEDRMRRLLKLMSKSPDSPLTPAIAQELCVRNGSEAFLNGTINSIGSRYVLWIRATRCSTGEVIAEEQAEAGHKEDVLGTLDSTARNLRTRLGESLTSISEHERPLAEVTTSSLEALKDFGQGVKTFYSGDRFGAIPMFRHAVELDPNFAAAWGYMACSCSVQPDVARANIIKAYALRERTTERERFFIEATYYEYGTGELDKAIATYELWIRLYPRDFEPQKSLALNYIYVGDAATATVWARRAIPLEDDPLNYHFLAVSYLRLNRLQEAEAILDEMDRRKLSEYFTVRVRYTLAFLAGDTARMNAWAASANGKPHAEDDTLAAEADTAFWYGNVKKGRALVQEAIDSARRHGAPETAAKYGAYEALYEAEIGNRTEARTEITAALKRSPNRDVLQVAPLVMAEIGDLAAAEKSRQDLIRREPLGTRTNTYFLPAIEAAIALQRKDLKRASRALINVSAIEQSYSAMLPVYLRGEAYLQEGKGELAVAEYRKFVDRFGLVGTAPQGALARLGLARGYAEARDIPKARAAYTSFLALWKDADSDIPILTSARQEFARLNTQSGSPHL